MDNYSEAYTDKEESEMLFEEADVDENIQLPENKEIVTEQKDEEIFSLHTKYLKGRLNTRPDYQRMYVWDNKKASRLIESILLNIPIPLIYMVAINGQINVIDGQQRLTSIFNFLDGKFKLTGLVAFSNLNKLSFKDLDEEYQNRINDYHIRTITFKSSAASDLQYEIFSRLNTGSVALNDQELRNCVYRGKFNDLLKELATNEKFLDILGLNGPHKRMQDVELVLRFLSFYINTYIKYKSSMKSFLNNTMNSENIVFSKDDSKAAEYRKVFNQAVNNVFSLLGTNCFRRFIKNKDSNDSTWESRRFNVSLYDILMWSLCEIDSNLLMRHKDAIREALINLMVEDDDFISSIQISTSDPKVVRRRFEIWKKTLDEILDNDKVEPRAFSLELKKKLFDENPTCAICHQKIENIDDAAVDHIEQYWLGGRTIPENARLTHRYCNNARKRKELGREAT